MTTNLARLAPLTATHDVPDAITYAFQPICNIHNGGIYGYEALLRGHREAGFSSIDHVFDAAFANGRLHAVDLELRARACAAYFSHVGADGPTLFFNLDNRILDSLDYRIGGTQALLAQH
ncbi:MAG TPA: GGDEF domain-containing protein, partial [Magnetovibrio sp.]